MACVFVLGGGKIEDICRMCSVEREGKEIAINQVVLTVAGTLKADTVESRYWRIDFESFCRLAIDWIMREDER